MDGWERVIIAKRQSQVLVSGLIGYRNETGIKRASVTRQKFERCNSLGSDLKILRQSTLRAADEAVLNKVLSKT